jgi:hypothetical protein
MIEMLKRHEIQVLRRVCFIGGLMPAVGTARPAPRRKVRRTSSVRTGALTQASAMLANIISAASGACSRKLRCGSCQNCVRYALKPRLDTVSCGDTLMHIVVAESRCWGVRWCVSVCVSTRDRNLFPSVLLQPLGHLSDLESTTCERSDTDYRTRRRLPEPVLDLVCIEWFDAYQDGRSRKLCQTF